MKENFIIGMDMSTLPEMERGGVRYFEAGQEKGLLEIAKEHGVDYIRIRLWNDPYSEAGEPFGAGTCDLATVIGLAKRVKEMGFSFLLDFHYSDFWADPGRQLIPKDWRGLSFEELLDEIYNFSKETLVALREAGCMPDMIQVGNEITNGMLWPVGRVYLDEELDEESRKVIEGLEKEGYSDPEDAQTARKGYRRLCALLNSAIAGIKEETSIPLMIHLERSFDCEAYREYFDQLVACGVEFDVIGLSYYPYWHHNMDELFANLNQLWQRYGKELFIAETSYAFTCKHFSEEEEDQALVVGPDFDWNGTTPLEFPLTVEGQAAYYGELLRRLKEHPGVRGVFYWEPGWIPTPPSTWATDAARIFIGETEKKGGNEWANQCLFDYEGNALPALDIFCDGRKRK